jgi:hypothetical protein
MSAHILNRESNEENGFRGERRPAIEEIEDEFLNQGDRHFNEDNVRRPEVLIDDDDMMQTVAAERGEEQGKGRGRRVGGGLVALIAIVVCAAVAGWFVIGKGATRKAKVPVNGSSSSSNSGADTEDAMMKQAIEQANVGGPGITLGDGSVVRPGMLPPVAGTAPGSSLPVTQMPPVINPDLSSTVNAAQPPASSASDGGGTGEVKQAVTRVANAVVGRNSEHSVMIEDVKAVADTRGAVTKGSGNIGEGRKDPSGIALPSFGSMLPVKSLGVLYTLRSGGLVRLELTRDVKGKNWSMPRGTVLVGAMRGAEYDRAFVSLVGFIDTESGRFVRITGDLLGSDGGTGIRGKKRKMSSGWSRALARLGETGLSIAGSLAASVGQRPIVISDAFGSYSGRVTNELDGALIGRDRNSFVEVAAGSSGYIMITELPESIQGVDALAKLSGSDVEQRANADQPRRLTGISERELVELIQSGDPEQIKAALPRMTPEMRRVAEAVVSGDLAAR